MDGGVDLALHYAASAAYERAEDNWVFIAEALEELRPRVGIAPDEFEAVVTRFAGVVDTNRTAPAVMRTMALAHGARVAAQLAADPDEGWFARRRWRKERDAATKALLAQAAITLDALLNERYAA
jgi:hypothetical protein